ncbi:flagellar biosynthesis anti-sigma factor FlgM [uncultured Propionivibrio sp.]|uniref:flagellar biosynthesis anti-sigma factor FlgM n=1 Tax=uncultured Propionivibrio sp. TaxID=426737 RepID=UPI0029C09EFD|nr:flagellar biosynthesis anti-sigma factor FlgM [uncultured Propionivibrio sp.]
MKIEGSTKFVGTSLVKETRSSPTQKATSARSDDVQLSTLSSQLRGVDDGYAFDAARVEEIKQAITDGQFKINPEAIADRLIASAKEFIDSNKRA